MLSTPPPTTQFPAIVARQEAPRKPVDETVEKKRSLTAAQMREAKAVYKSFDANNDGVLSFLLGPRVQTIEILRGCPALMTVPPLARLPGDG